MEGGKSIPKAILPIVMSTKSLLDAVILGVIHFWRRDIFMDFRYEACFSMDRLNFGMSSWRCLEKPPRSLPSIKIIARD
jgi:hypothetical protein